MKLSVEVNRALNGRVRINDRFWNSKLETLFNVTLNDTFDKFEKDGAIENYINLAAGKLHTHRACSFHDGLLLETIRGAADYLTREENAGLVERIDGYIEIIERAQLASGGGYLSTYTQLDCPEQRYGENGGDLINQHDLYNNGALFEAGVHYYLATGKTKLLECAVRSANELADTIGKPPKKWIVPAHSLPEYALIELWQLLCQQPGLMEQLSVPARPDAYRELASFWIHGRGHHSLRTNNPQYLGEYAQDHAPIEAQFQAVGHAVRATLYYTGVTRLAMLDGDASLLESSMRLWDNVETRKMHINGGVGATHFEEKFGRDYDLVNSGYLETCASAGLIFWAESLSRATGDARYFQTVERALYNLMLSSVTLQGDSYFYRNPLVSDGNDHHWAWHGCPCCPAMIHKIFGMIDRLICAQDDAGIYVNLFIGGDITTEMPWGQVELETCTELPWNGEYSVRVRRSESPLELRIRVPQWARDIRFRLNGVDVAPEVRQGYATFSVREGDEISFIDSMPPMRIEAHPYVRSDRGRVALARGPLVYCVEGLDNNGAANFEIAEEPELSIEERSDLLGGVTVIHGNTVSGGRFTAIPLYAWDNRMACGMSVWLSQAGKADDWSVDGWEGRLYRPYLRYVPRKSGIRSTGGYK